MQYSMMSSLNYVNLFNQNYINNNIIMTTIISEGSNSLTLYTESIMDDFALKAIASNLDKFTPQEIEDFFNSKND